MGRIRAVLVESNHVRSRVVEVARGSGVGGSESEKGGFAGIDGEFVGGGGGSEEEKNADARRGHLRGYLSAHDCCGAATFFIINFSRHSLSPALSFNSSIAAALAAAPPPPLLACFCCCCSLLAAALASSSSAVAVASVHQPHTSLRFSFLWNVELQFGSK